MSISIQDLLRDKPPVMVLDMGLGSREQSLPAHDPAPAPIIAVEQAEAANPVIATSRG